MLTSWSSTTSRQPAVVSIKGAFIGSWYSLVSGVHGLGGRNFDGLNELGELGKMAFQGFDSVSVRESGEGGGVSDERIALGGEAKFVELSRKGAGIVDGEGFIQCRPFGIEQMPQTESQRLPFSGAFGRRNGDARKAVSGRKL